MERRPHQILDRIYAQLGVTTDADFIARLPSHLRISRKTLSRWRQTGHIPEHWYTALMEHLSDNDAILRVPILEQPAGAGKSLASGADDIIGYYPIPRMLLPSAGDYAIMRAHGDSMAPTIRSGDLLLIRRYNGEPIHDGMIYVVRYDGWIMVRRLRAAKRTIQLCADNDAAQIIEARSSDVEIIACVYAIMMQIV